MGAYGSGVRGGKHAQKLTCYEHETPRIDSYAFRDEGDTVTLQVGARLHDISLTWQMNGIAPRRQFICPRCGVRCESLFVRNDWLLCRLCAKVKYQSPARRAELAAARELAHLRTWHRRAQRAAMQAATLGAPRPDVSGRESAPVWSESHCETPISQSWGNSISDSPACPTPSIENTRRVIADKRRRHATIKRIHKSRAGL